MDRSELERRLLVGVGQLAAVVDGAAIAKLADLALLVAKWAERINLTGHRDATSVVDALILDALALWQMILEVSRASGRPSRIADLGSGAGFPGLPIALIEPDLEVELIESRQRRHHFQRAACRELAIPNAKPRLGRIEALLADHADIVVAQAVGPITEVVDLAARWVRPGGWLFVPFGPTPPALEPGSEWSASGARRYESPSAAPHTVWYAQRAL